RRACAGAVHLIDRRMVDRLAVEYLDFSECRISQDHRAGQYVPAEVETGGSGRRYPLTHIAGRGRAGQPIDPPAVPQDDDRLRACRDPRLMYDMPRQIEVPALPDIEALARVAVLEMVRPAEDDMGLALLVRVLRDVEGGGKVNQQGCGARNGVNAQDSVE